jgi:hypothetical protein
MGRAMTTPSERPRITLVPVPAELVRFDAVALGIVYRDSYDSQRPWQWQAFPHGKWGDAETREAALWRVVHGGDEE